MMLGITRCFFNLNTAQGRLQHFRAQNPQGGLTYFIQMGAGYRVQLLRDLGDNELADLSELVNQQANDQVPPGIREAIE